MTGRLLVAWIVTILLVGPAAAQVAPVPPPASRISPATGTEEARTPPITAPLPASAFEPGPPVVPPPQLPPPIQPPAFEGQSWARVEALLWFIEGARLPPLLTTSQPGTPLNTAGVLGPGSIAHVGFGQSDAGSGLTAGANTVLGTWLDPEHRFGMETAFLATTPQGKSVASNPATGPSIVARPFIDPTTGKEAASVVNFPGTVRGNFYGSYTSSGLIGTGIWFTERIAYSQDPFCMCRRCGNCGSGCGGCGDGGDPLADVYFRVDSLLGYRFLRLEDHFDANSTMTNLVLRPSGPPGTVIRTTDQIRTTNNFNGVDLGFRGELSKGNFYIESLLKGAFGVNSIATHLYGAHTVNGVLAPGGGFLVQPSNFGTFTKNTGTVIPQIGLNLGYRLGDHLRLYTGYTLLYWFHLQRSGDAIDRDINPGFLNGTTVGAGNAHPFPPNNQTNIWVQGVNLGAEFRY